MIDLCILCGKRMLDIEGKTMTNETKYFPSFKVHEKCFEDKKHQIMINQEKRRKRENGHKEETN